MSHFRALDLDLRIQHAGHELILTGSGGSFVARFPTLLSLLHFARLSWPFRAHLPPDASLQVQWRWLHLPVHASQ